MTYKLLKQIFEENNISQDAVILSDSGWECGPTDMDGVYYSKECNCVIFTQGKHYEPEIIPRNWEHSETFKCLYNYDRISGAVFKGERE